MPAAVRQLLPSDRRAAIVAAVIVLLLFIVAAWVARGHSLTGIDHGARTLIRHGRPPALERPMRVISVLGSGDVLFPVTLVCSAVLWRKRHRALALWLPAVGLATSASLALMKWVINKPRPTLRGYGFPSGHVYGATVFVVLALYLLWAFGAPRRTVRIAGACGVAFITLVGYSRIFLGAHWLSDLVGGLLAGITFSLAAVLVLDRRLR